MVLFNTIDTGMPNMSSRNAHCAWPYPLPNAYNGYIPRAFARWPVPHGRTATGHGAKKVLAGVRFRLLLLLLLLPPVHTGTPVLGQQGPTVHGVSTLGESHMCRDWDQSAD